MCLTMYTPIPKNFDPVCSRLRVIFNEAESYKPEPKVAEKDIVCYKVLNVNHYEKHKSVDELEFSTPFQRFRVVPGTRRYKAKGDVEIEVVNYLTKERMSNYDYRELREEYGEDNNGLFEWSLTGGAFHSFLYLYDAIQRIEDFGNGNMVVKCIIPKGTEYYEGFFDGNIRSIASKELIITKKLAYYPDILKEVENMDTNVYIFYEAEVENRKLMIEYFDIPLKENGRFDYIRMAEFDGRNKNEHD